MPCDEKHTECILCSLSLCSHTWGKVSSPLSNVGYSANVVIVLWCLEFVISLADRAFHALVGTLYVDQITAPGAISLLVAFLAEVEISIPAAFKALEVRGREGPFYCYVAED